MTIPNGRTHGNTKKGGGQVRHRVPPIDLEFPVVRAIVPGLELTADFDAHSRPSVRLFRRYLEKAGSFERE